MVRLRRLLIALIMATGLCLTAQAPAFGSAADPCTGAGVFAGCTNVDAYVGPDDVTLTGTATSPGTGGVSTHTGHEAAPNTCKIRIGLRCYGVEPPPANPAAPAQPITLRDIASFRPAPGIQRMEPNGWVVAGLDANIYSIVGRQLVGGTLLAQPATVRFTPVAWHWNYGDGTAVVRTTKGATWAAQGLHDFDPTPTSHVYEVEGDYVIHLTIDFRAEYRFGSGGFVAIPGRIALPANDLRITVTGAKTVLVDRDCVANPSGPGC